MHFQIFYSSFLLSDTLSKKPQCCIIIIIFLVFAVVVHMSCCLIASLTTVYWTKKVIGLDAKLTKWEEADIGTDN